jgi:hypothetical protein
MVLGGASGAGRAELCGRRWAERATLGGRSNAEQAELERAQRAALCGQSGRAELLGSRAGGEGEDAASGEVEDADAALMEWGPTCQCGKGWSGGGG